MKGKGIGTLLMKSAVEWAEMTGTLEILADGKAPQKSRFFGDPATARHDRWGDYSRESASTNGKCSV